jgi:ElaB/YqjD/DUF883 family membrane-anchored ribosome-binding protein
MESSACIGRQGGQAMTDSTLQQELNTLKEDVAKLRADVQNLTSALKDLGVEQVEGIRSTVAEEIRAARGELQRRAGQARDYGRRAVDSLEEEIGDHPLPSILSAFGIGFVLARLLDVGSRR